MIGFTRCAQSRSCFVRICSTKLQGSRQQDKPSTPSCLQPADNVYPWMFLMTDGGFKTHTCRLGSIVAWGHLGRDSREIGISNWTHWTQLILSVVEFREVYRTSGSLKFCPSAGGLVSRRATIQRTRSWCMSVGSMSLTPASHFFAL